MKFVKSIGMAFVGLVALSGVALAESGIDRYNAQLNSPAGKRETLARVCKGSSNAEFFLCEKWKREGVPNSDVRYGIVGAAAIAGAAAGGIVAASPGIVGASAPLTVFGKVVTVPMGMAAGAAVGATAGVLASQ